MPRRVLPACCLLLLCAACSAPEPDAVVLTGRAVLPADTFGGGPPVGSALSGDLHGRRAPFAGVPVQGFSSLLPVAGGTWLALQDNGFGTRANSPDVPLRWYRLRLQLDDPPPAGGKVDVLGHTDLRDASGRVLTGADFDPESCARLDDGTLWIGEEFGPFLLHVGADGRLLGPPVGVPAPEDLRELARGADHLRTPDHPELRDLDEPAALARANLPRSGGLEGLARTPRGDRLYASVEKALVDDPDPRRRLILEFDPAAGRFTGSRWWHRVDAPGVSIASLEAVGADVLLLVERDEAEGAEAAVKRVYRVDLREADAAGYLPKTLVADLLDIADPDGLTVAEPGAVGLGPRYAFPYVTPECLVVLDRRTLLIACDNNYPLTSGRRPPATPDDSEFIRLHLPVALDAGDR